MTSLSIGLPAHNEAENIGPMIDMARTKVGPLVDDLEIIVVDDGSSDGTGAIVRAMAEEDPRIRLVEHPVNQGYGAAVRDAIWSATKELVFFTDSDRQFDLGELERFLARIEDADMVIGYRYA
ncbi:MAG TPA: glycosyltransferase family 2 protein, partial [Chloroflexi bacterium]|nr:glycosyltransferase family 2 protein [Chloroflexota bacterium]